MDIFKSKRFWAAIATLVVLLGENFGLNLDETTVQNFVMVVAAWIVGDSLRHKPAASLK